MFSCTIEFICDICGKGFKSHGERISDCISKCRFRKKLREDGWRTVFGKYDVCYDCITNFGIKSIRNKIKESEQE